MKSPEFPMPAGEYVVSNGVSNISLLRVDEPAAAGEQSWSLSDSMTIADVTHGPCRSARYRPRQTSGQCSPENAPQTVFPLGPGEQPPSVQYCDRKIYAVLIVIGRPVYA
ncbi:MAG: hypothetical protein AAF499_14135 [Pseudomonadota bacterium]